MRIKTIFAISIVLACQTLSANAQMSTYRGSWGDSIGLTVSSDQRAYAVPTKLRLFATLKATASDPTKATMDLRKLKDDTIEKLVAIGADRAMIDFAPTRIREWDDSRFDERVFGYYGERSKTMTATNDAPEMFTAHAAIQVDWLIKEQEMDEVILVPISLVERIRENSIFNPVNEDPDAMESETFGELQLIYVGDIPEETDQAKFKAAVDEAVAQAKQIEAATGIELGKLEYMSPSVNDRWRYEYSTSYTDNKRRDSDFPNPISLFRHTETEVYGADPSNLYRDFSVMLRYALK